MTQNGRDLPEAPAGLGSQSALKAQSQTGHLMMLSENPLLVPVCCVITWHMPIDLSGQEMCLFLLWFYWEGLVAGTGAEE